MFAKKGRGSVVHTSDVINKYKTKFPSKKLIDKRIYGKRHENIDPFTGNKINSSKTLSWNELSSGMKKIYETHYPDQAKQMKKEQRILDKNRG